MTLNMCQWMLRQLKEKLVDQLCHDLNELASSWAYIEPFIQESENKCANWGRCLHLISIADGKGFDDDMLADLTNKYSTDWDSKRKNLYLSYLKVIHWEGHQFIGRPNWICLWNNKNWPDIWISA